MPQYIVRVELHSATETDYANLHTYMEQAGFSRTIVGSDGVKYHLPTAEYYKQTSQNLDLVYNAAHAAATLVGKRFSILITEANRIQWVGLSRA